MKIPGFTLEKYMKLRESKLSIISINCFAGFFYHRFGLPFLSPTINMWQTGESFLKMVSNLKYNIGSPLIFNKVKYSKASKFIFPSYFLGDSELNMNHYNNFDEAEAKWYERVKRINYDNLLIVMFTLFKEEAESFDSLPYSKKVCFVPFKSNLKSAFYIPCQTNERSELWGRVNKLADGRFPLYDLWDLALYGKKTQRMDFDLM
ncbi:MAG: DUF1919 domain-containing protein [Selenomonadaceae bacterium]|nr:DUF1919 domain-containing protein [Selenomonadaceae bacterium]